MRPAPFSTVTASKRARWAITIGATVVSTYALDALATVAGLLLVRSQVFRGLELGPVLLLLAATYVLWGVGLRANLTANLTLLEQTGTSTNVLSKAAYDLARRATSSQRRLRLAAGIGYVGTELAKEVPYYVGAFGVAIASDAISSNEALVFLAGTNLGAAAYEYGLARLTRVVLRHSQETSPAPRRERRDPGRRHPRRSIPTHMPPQAPSPMLLGTRCDGKRFGAETHIPFPRDEQALIELDLND